MGKFFLIVFLLLGIVLFWYFYFPRGDQSALDELPSAVDDRLPKPAPPNRFDWDNIPREGKG